MVPQLAEPAIDRMQGGKLLGRKHMGSPLEIASSTSASADADLDVRLSRKRVTIAQSDRFHSAAPCGYAAHGRSGST